MNTVTSADGLYQWDTGQILRINGLNLSVAPKVHFATKVDETAYVVQSEMSGTTITVGIPDKVLTHGYPIIAYVYLEQGTDKRTIKSITIPVIKRAKPSTWKETNAESIIEAVNLYEQLTEEMQEMRDLLEALDASGGGIVGHMTNTNNPHGVTAEQVGALPIRGGTLINDLGLNGGYARLNADNNGALLNTYTEGNLTGKRRALWVRNVDDKKEALCLYDEITGNGSIYSILGTHNMADFVLPLDGSVAMSGKLNIGNDLGRIDADTTQAYLMSRESKDGSGMSKLLSIRHSSNIPVAIQTYQDGVYVSGSTKAIFGEHNVTCGTSDITAGTTALTTGCYYDVYK